MSNADEYVNQYRRRAVHPGTALLCSQDELRGLEFHNQEQLVDFINDFRLHSPNDDPFTLQTIRRMHAITVASIYRSAGQLRGPNDEVEIPGGTFDPSPGADVFADLQQLIQDIGEIAENPATFVDLIYASATAFHRFLKIHPFLDGNGRVGRGLLHFMLYEFDLLTPPEQIYDFIEAHRRDYYVVLSQADGGNKIPLCEFVLDGVIDWQFQRVFDTVMSGPFAPYVQQKLSRRYQRLMIRTNRWSTPRPVRKRRVNEVIDHLHEVLSRIK